MKIKKILIIGIVILIALFTLRFLDNPIPEKVAPSTGEKVRLGLSWIHQAQFSGEYYADQKGLYNAEGLTVDLIPASLETDPLEFFLKGKFDFVIAQPDSLIRARANGAKIKAIATTYRIHPMVIASLKEKNIKKPQDLIGQTIGIAYSEELLLKTLLKKVNIPLKKLNIVTRKYDLKGIQNHQLNAQGAWMTDEIQTAKRNGISLNMILPADYEVFFYADVIVTTEKMIEEHPELVERFLRATLKGWRKAIENPEQTAQLTLHYNKKLKPEHEISVLTASIPLIHTGENQIGWMKKEVWEDIIQVMSTQELIPQTIPAKEIYTMEFLKKIYH